jgi:hypothetical protein
MNEVDLKVFQLQNIFVNGIFDLVNLKRKKVNVIQILLFIQFDILKQDLKLQRNQVEKFFKKVFL